MENNMRKEMEEKEKQDFKVLGLSSFIYAVVLTFCLYKNFRELPMCCGQWQR